MHNPEAGASSGSVPAAQWTLTDSGLRVYDNPDADVGIEPGWIAAAKHAFTTRRADLGRVCALRRTGAPRPGDLVLAGVTALGRHRALENAAGRRVRLHVGDEIVVAYGARYAPDQYEAEVPQAIGPCDLVAGGGVAGRVLSRHASMSAPTRLEPIGLLVDQDRAVINLSRFALPQMSRGPARNIIVIAGASMNAGKTTSAAACIKGLCSAGLRVAAGKLTGTGSGGDLWTMHDAGASVVLDFTDAGHATTAGLDPAAVLDCANSILDHLEAAAPDVIVVEIADGVLQRETRALLSEPRFVSRIDAILFAAGEALSALAGANWMTARGLPLVGLTGVLSASPLASREAAAETGLPVFGIADLQSFVTAQTLIAPRMMVQPVP